MRTASRSNCSRHSEDDDEGDELVIDIWDTTSPNTGSISNSILHLNSGSVSQMNSSPPPGFRITITDSLKPIYMSYLQEVGHIKIPLVELVLFSEPPILEFAEICKLVSKHDGAGTERPIIHLLILLLTTYTILPNSDSTPAIVRILARSPKDTGKLSLSPDESAKYTKALCLAARVLLDDHRANFLAALFTTPSICAGSLEWFLGIFPNFEGELKVGLVRLEAKIGVVVETCRRNVAKMRGVERELVVLSGAPEGVKAVGDWIEVKIGDLERGRGLLKGEVPAACKVLSYLIAAHGVMFNEKDEEVEAMTEVSLKREGEEMKLENVDELLEMRSAVNVKDEEMEATTGAILKREGEDMRLENAGEPLGKRRAIKVEKDIGTPAREERRVSTPSGRGFYKGRNYDPNYRGRGRGYRGWVGGYWGHSPYRGHGGRPGVGYYS